MKLVLFSFFVILSIVSGCDSSGIENTGNFGSSKNQGSRSGSGSNQSSNNPVPTAGKTNKTGKNLEELEKLEDLVNLGEPINKGAPKANSPTTEPIKLADNKQSSKPVVNPALTTGNPPKAPVANPAPVPAPTVNPAPKSVVNPVPAASNPPKASVANPAPPKTVVNPVPAANNPTPGPVANSAPAIAPDAKKIVDNIFSSDEKYSVYRYIKENGNGETKAMELIDAGILAKIFDSETISECIRKNHNSVRLVNNITYLSGISDNVNNKIIDEIKKNNYIKKLTIDEVEKKAFLTLLPDKITNDPEIGRQIEFVDLLSKPISSVINDFLNTNSQNDLEKTKLAIELIDKGLIANLFTILAQDILNENNLAFNDDIKNKIIEKIKNDKIIGKISYDNYIYNNESIFLRSLAMLPDYLLNDKDINNQIKMAIYKNMSLNGGFEAIYNEFIKYTLVISEKIKNLVLDIMAIFFDHLLERDDKGALKNKDFLNKNVFPVTFSRSIKESFIVFELLKDKFKNNESKNYFCYIILKLIFEKYKNHDLAELIKDFNNEEFDNEEFSRLKNYMTEYVNALTEEKKNEFKSYIENIKRLGFLS